MSSLNIMTEKLGELVGCDEAGRANSNSNSNFNSNSNSNSYFNSKSISNSNSMGFRSNF